METKGSKRSKGFFYEYQPPPRPYDSYSWRPPPPHTYSYTQGSSHDDNGDDHHDQRYWAGSNNHQASEGQETKRSWTATAGIHRSSSHQGPVKRPGLRPHKKYLGLRLLHQQEWMLTHQAITFSMEKRV